MASLFKIRRERPHNIMYFIFHADFISRRDENILKLTGTQNIWNLEQYAIPALRLQVKKTYSENGRTAVSILHLTT